MLVLSRWAFSRNRPGPGGELAARCCWTRSRCSLLTPASALAPPHPNIYPNIYHISGVKNASHRDTKQRWVPDLIQGTGIQPSDTFCWQFTSRSQPSVARLRRCNSSTLTTQRRSDRDSGAWHRFRSTGTARPFPPATEDPRRGRYAVALLRRAERPAVDASSLRFPSRSISAQGGNGHPGRRQPSPGRPYVYFCAHPTHYLCTRSPGTIRPSIRRLLYRYVLRLRPRPRPRPTSVVRQSPRTPADFFLTRLRARSFPTAPARVKNSCSGSKKCSGIAGKTYPVCIDESTRPPRPPPSLPRSLPLLRAPLPSTTNTSSTRRPTVTSSP